MQTCFGISEYQPHINRTLRMYTVPSNDRPVLPDARARPMPGSRSAGSARRSWRQLHQHAHFAPIALHCRVETKLGQHIKVPYVRVVSVAVVKLAVHHLQRNLPNGAKARLETHRKSWRAPQNMVNSGTGTRTLGGRHKGSKGSYLTKPNA